MTATDPTPPGTDAIDPRAGEELVHMEDHGAYTFVVVKRPDAPEGARGPFAYHVRWIPDIDGDGGSYRWQYLGETYDEEEEKQHD
ncbi:hypothetical protein [Halapricum hydrolyticum]|uniref:Uncharacterized protein n=1 Tax=Halapricum hydrolyticum TaxID=2979991 RepID=A0AAE3LGQ2_9EURY|nr:hypothetical protein [Halapricum hydrolyticum]MCU4716501.1 hypothetical protein [Halapricum hydrolyticum]MCU4725894.1 hypothetical protein [Halapricum hydrolyticum]